MNAAKFQRGQEFLMNNWRSYEVGEASNLIGLLAISSLANILLFTALNDCPASSSKRYITTLGNIRLWGTADIESREGVDALLTSVKKVREVHSRMGERVRKVNKLNGITNNNKDLTRNLTLQEEIWDALKKDMEAAFTPKQLRLSRCYKAGLKKYLFVNQFEYALTQWSTGWIFTPPLSDILFPRASNTELEAVNHFLGVIGWLLGIDDKFNIGLQKNLSEHSKYYGELKKTFIVSALYHIDTNSKYLIELTLDRITPYSKVG